MGYFENLVQSQFLMNAKEELLNAQQALIKGIVSPPIHYASKKTKRRIFKKYIQHYGLLEEIVDQIVTQGDLEPSTTYLFIIEHLIFMYSLDPKQIKKALQYTFKVDGNLPYYKSKLNINRMCSVYTALVDTRLGYTPPSPM